MLDCISSVMINLQLPHCRILLANFLHLSPELITTLHAYQSCFDWPLRFWIGWVGSGIRIGVEIHWSDK